MKRLNKLQATSHFGGLESSDILEFDAFFFAEFV